MKKKVGSAPSRSKRRPFLAFLLQLLLTSFGTGSQDLFEANFLLMAAS